MIATGLVFLPATPVFLLTRGHDSTVVKSTEITAQIDGATSILSAGLQRSREGSSELAEMMDYLPPRVFNGEGREGDMLNLVFVAQPEDLQEAFARAGWVKTDKWKPIFVWHLLRHRTNDAQLPMARFYLFGRVQDYSYALPDPDAIVSRRHHLRIWKTDYTMDGTPIWAGAATHDVAIEIAKRGRLINHQDRPRGGCRARFRRHRPDRNFVGQPAGIFAFCRSGFPGANCVRRELSLRQQNSSPGSPSGQLSQDWRSRSVVRCGSGDLAAQRRFGRFFRERSDIAVLKER